MNDLERYLTDEVAEMALAAGNAASECYYGCPSDMTTTEMHAALTAALPDIIQKAKAEALRDADEHLARAAFAVDSKHHIHGTTCLCGFEGNTRKRTQTEHITAAVIEEYNHHD